VSDPGTYSPLGVAGTLARIAAEGPNPGGRKLWAGLPPLMLRQVLFGSVKFLAYDAVKSYAAAAGLFGVGEGENALLLTFACGGVAGVLSSTVSQPADSLLTYIASGGGGGGGGGDKGKGDKGIKHVLTRFLNEEGVRGLFNGLGSRCLWSGSIIGGQFFLYEVFRNMLGVGAESLQEVFIVSFT